MKVETNASHVWGVPTKSFLIPFLLFDHILVNKQEMEILLELQVTFGFV